jgi:hypothetical protein
MASIPKSMGVACIFLMLASTASMKAAPQGFMEGHLKIVVIRPVEADDMPQPTAETYAEYPLIILSQDDKREIACLTADKSGNYRVALPPGAYILAVQERPAEERAAERIHATRQPFTVASNQTVRVDMTIFMGPTKGQASAYSDSLILKIDPGSFADQPGPPRRHNTQRRGMCVDAYTGRETKRDRGEAEG